MNSAFAFRVTPEGVTMNFNPELEFAIIKEELLNHVKDSSGFFAGVDIYINLAGCCFTAEQISEIIDIVAGYERIKKIYFTSEQRKTKGRDTVLLQGTIRSGQKIKYPSNIVLVGDVNPGAEVIAAGDIIVLGKLRGVVHAGAGGVDEAQVIAFKLQPTQVRIASYISRAPEEARQKNNVFKPERAYVKDSTIVVEELEL